MKKKLAPLFDVPEKRELCNEFFDGIESKEIRKIILKTLIKKLSKVFKNKEVREDAYEHLRNSLRTMSAKIRSELVDIVLQTFLEGKVLKNLRGRRLMDEKVRVNSEQTALKQMTYTFNSGKELKERIDVFVEEILGKLKSTLEKRWIGRTLLQNMRKKGKKTTEARGKLVSVDTRPPFGEYEDLNDICLNFVFDDEENNITRSGKEARKEIRLG